MFAPGETMNLDEIVATGELYKQGSGRKNWCLRKFILSGIYMVYFDRKGEKKGQWDITDCICKKLTPEECNMAAAKHAFALIGKGKHYLACASSEKNRNAWITVLEEQIEEFKEDIRRFLRSGEVVHGNAIVKKKNMLGITSNVRLLLTNFPRIMVIEPASLVLKDQLSWGRDFPPSFSRITDTKFKISLNGKDMTFEDMENGTKYWEDIFRRFPNMKYYVQKAQKALNIDYHDFVDVDEDEKFKQMLEAPVQRTPQEIAREERNKANLKFLEEALRNISELVTALSGKIDDLDDQENTAKAAGVNSEASSLERANKRAQLQILKDNVSVLASNLQSLVTKSMETGTTDFDIDAIQSVINETRAMLEILNSGEEEFFPGYDNEGVNSADVGEQIETVNGIVEGVEWMVLEDSLTNDAFAQLDAIDDIVFNKDNFDADDPNKRPANWKELRLKRVMMKEYVDRLEGVPETVIQERRAKRMALEEKLMVREVVEVGRLKNMPVLRKVRTPSQRALEAACMAITSDNFDPDDPDKRPLAWQAVKLRRIITKEDIYRRQGKSEAEIEAGHANLLAEEEKLMLAEVKRDGKITNFGLPNAQRAPLRASQMTINAQTFDPKDPKKRPNGWFEIRRQRVLVKEQIDRLNGVDEQTIYDMRPQREREEEELMIKEAVSSRRVMSVRYETQSGDETEATMKFTAENFDPSDINKRPKGWFDIRQKRILVKEQIDRINGVSEDAIADMRHQRELEEEALMLSEVAQYGKLIGADQRARENQAVVITKTNFSATDASKRPPGWADLRLKRVMLKEHIDRIAGIDEDLIIDMRADREIQEEQLMIDEALCLGRVLGVGESSRSLIPYVPHIVFSSANFDPKDPNKRPHGWLEAKTKRVMMKEQIDRLNGVSEADIAKRHDKRMDDEELLMLEEVAKFGHLVGVGGPATDNDLPLKVPVLVFNADNYDPNDPTKRPEGWAAARKKRVYKKEQLDRLRGFTNSAIEEKRRQREIDEEKIMMDEVAQHGHLIGIGGPVKAVASKNVNDSLDINDANFDAATGMRPKGWAEVKLRRVYLKEWKDRRDGVDEDEIMLRRGKREQEVEQEMINEASVYGRVRAIENRIKNAKNVQPIFPKGYKGHVHNKPAGSKGQGVQLATFINAANQTFESLSDKVAETLAEKVLGEEPGSRASRKFRTTPQAPPPPRVIAPRPRPIAGGLSKDASNRLLARPGLPTGESSRTNRANTMKSDLSELGINEENFDVNDPRKRPPGWADVRRARVEALEKEDQAKGVSTYEVLAKREKRETEEEERMIDEASGRAGGATPVVLTTNFRSNLIATSNNGGSRGVTAKILAKSGSTR